MFYKQGHEIIVENNLVHETECMGYKRPIRVTLYEEVVRDYVVFEGEMYVIDVIREE